MKIVILEMFLIEAIGAHNLEYWQFIIHGISMRYILMNFSVQELYNHLKFSKDSNAPYIIHKYILKFLLDILDSQYPSVFRSSRLSIDSPLYHLMRLSNEDLIFAILNFNYSQIISSPIIVIFKYI